MVKSEISKHFSQLIRTEETLLETQRGSIKTYSKDANYESECWVHLRQDKVQWQVGVGTATNISVNYQQIAVVRTQMTTPTIFRLFLIAIFWEHRCVLKYII
jgi:hypothetical protein